MTKKEKTRPLAGRAGAEIQRYFTTRSGPRTLPGQRKRNLDRERAYYLANRERLLAQGRAYYLAHRDEIRAAQRKRYQERKRRKQNAESAFGRTGQGGGPDAVAK